MHTVGSTQYSELLIVVKQRDKFLTKLNLIISILKLYCKSILVFNIDNNSETLSSSNWYFQVLNRRTTMKYENELFMV